MLSSHWEPKLRSKKCLEGSEEEGDEIGGDGEAVAQPTDPASPSSISSGWIACSDTPKRWSRGWFRRIWPLHGMDSWGWNVTSSTSRFPLHLPMKVFNLGMVILTNNKNHMAKTMKWKLKMLKKNWRDLSFSFVIVWYPLVILLFSYGVLNVQVMQPTINIMLVAIPGRAWLKENWC